jgi:hypothetical protein
MTTSLVDGGAGKEEEEGTKGMYALNGDNLFSIVSGGGQLEDGGREAGSLYIVSEGMREYNSSGRTHAYMVGRREGEEEEGERGFSSPSSPNNSQALITHKVRKKEGVEKPPR